MKNIVILGATSAISLAVIERLSIKYPKATFHLFARNKTKLDASTCKYQFDFKPYIYDLSDMSLHPQILSELQATPIDLCLIAYGILKSDQNELEIINTNFTSAVSLINLLKDKINENGRIAVITSVAGDRGRSDNYLYGASKGALSIYLSGLRAQLYAKNIFVIDIKAGPIDSPMTSHLKKSIYFSTTSKVAKDIVQAIDKKSDVIYSPYYWRYIMCFIKMLPEFIFKRLF